MLEVLQFGRDAYVAESWLAGQEPLVRAAELGSNVDEVESLIKRHEAFEKLAAAWEERFVLLEKLTTVSPEISSITLNFYLHINVMWFVFVGLGGTVHDVHCTLMNISVTCLSDTHL